MSNFSYSSFGSYQFGATEPLSDRAMAALVRLIETPVRRSSTALGGRGGIASGEVPGFGQVVVKHYLRGGILRHMISKRFFRMGVVRPQSEFELLTAVQALGIPAPQPVAFATEGKRWYRGWLFTKQLPEHKTLAEPGVLEGWNSDEVFDQLGRLVRTLIDHRIFHIDLHPGNVLIDQQGKLYLVDFDKARRFRGSAKELRELYLRRWRRAVIKHELPEVFSELMCGTLRSAPISDLRCELGT